jgi:hypothetical protein
MRTLLMTCMLIAAARLDAQRMMVTAPTDLFHAPNGRVIATLAKGEVTAGPERAGFVQIALQGYVPTRSLGGARDSFAITIKDGSVSLRAAGNATAPAIATLRQGMGFNLMHRGDEWTQVSRNGWVRKSALHSIVAQTTPEPRPAHSTDPKPGRIGPPERSLDPSPVVIGGPTSSAGRPGPPSGESDSATLLTSGRATLRDGPGGKALAAVAQSARLQPLYRERGWVKVRLEGWVKDTDVQDVDTTARSALLPADLRANPEGTRGKVVRWDVQYLATQTADPLQRDLALNEPYMLARGPGSDHALVYLSVPPSLAATARRLPPLTFVTVIARVRNGRSAPGCVPILDVQSLITK